MPTRNRAATRYTGYAMPNSDPLPKSLNAWLCTRYVCEPSVLMARIRPRAPSRAASVTMNGAIRV
jgi:hypothetical protein